MNHYYIYTSKYSHSLTEIYMLPYTHSTQVKHIFYHLFAIKYNSNIITFKDTQNMRSLSPNPLGFIIELRDQLLPLFHFLIRIYLDIHIKTYNIIIEDNNNGILQNIQNCKYISRTPKFYRIT